MMRTTQAAGCPCIPTWERSTFRVRSTVAHRPDAYRVGRGGGNRIHRGRMALFPEPSERAAHQDIHGYHGRVSAFFLLVCAYAWLERNGAVFDLSFSFLLTALIGLAATRICRAVFLRHNPAYRIKAAKTTTPGSVSGVAEEIGKPSYEGLKCGGGELGIRTPDTLLGCTRLAGEHLRPLGQLSAV